MINYRIWKCEDVDYILVEVLNEHDIQRIQKMFIEKGYIIIETEFNVFGNHFIKLESLNSEESDNEI